MAGERKKDYMDPCIQMTRFCCETKKYLKLIVGCFVRLCRKKGARKSIKIKPSEGVRKEGGNGM